ncbi:hypothetical protein C5F47_07120 [Nitrosopumilus cobalaminigenes]|uniref:Uncharacterized protein n=1 Tax=Nitrosopumilus cobalaminigenes TaxID=1470066 RepID=A0A7D5M3Y9_9ARCH|nr:hypothetical protein C5F47_07120 [Nitrosopumilus cobalaminigenes]
MTDERNLKPSNIPTKETIVLRTKLLPQDIIEILDKKKTSFFGSALRRPKSDEITVETPQLYLEQYVFILGHYEIDFDRNASYMIKVDPDVVEVAIGTKKFPVLNESGVWKKFGKKMKQGVGITKQDLELNVTENAVKSMTDSMYFDHNGLETTFDYSTDSDAVENFVQNVLDVNKSHTRKIKMTNNELFSKLFHKLKESLKHDLIINHEEYVVTKFQEIFVPIYETKCYDEKNKVVVARVDAVTGKII